MSNLPRIPAIDTRGLGPEQRSLYDAVVGGPRGSGPQHFSLVDSDGRLVGPFNAMLLQPSIGKPLQALGSALRFDSTFTPRERELAILVVAGHWGSSFESDSHTAVAKSIGLSDSEIEAAIAADPSAISDEREAAVISTVRDLVRNWTLSDEEWAASVSSVGREVLFELTTLVGYYSLLALQLRVFSDEA